LIPYDVIQAGKSCYFNKVLAKLHSIVANIFQQSDSLMEYVQDSDQEMQCNAKQSKIERRKQSATNSRKAGPQARRSAK
jgi:hypothetical protein